MQVRQNNMETTLTPRVIKKVADAKTMDFPDAMREIIAGNKVARVSWGNPDYCFLRDGWLIIFTKGAFHTWSVNDGDMEGQDWVIVEK